jgi:hypothetical protein
MKLYKTLMPDGHAKWDGTQADARETRHEAGYTKTKNTEEVDVPTDKAGLLKFLNDNNVGGRLGELLTRMATSAKSAPSKSASRPGRGARQ